MLSRTVEHAAGFHIAADVSALWTLLGRLVSEMPRPIFLIGGAECYRLLLPYVHRAYVTRLTGDYGADAFLPPLDGFARTELRRGEHCMFEIYERI